MNHLLLLQSALLTTIAFLFGAQYPNAFNSITTPMIAGVGHVAGRINYLAATGFNVIQVPESVVCHPQMSLPMPPVFHDEHQFVVTSLAPRPTVEPVATIYTFEPVQNDYGFLPWSFLAIGLIVLLAGALVVAFVAMKHRIHILNLECDIVQGHNNTLKDQKTALGRQFQKLSDDRDTLIETHNRSIQAAIKKGGEQAAKFCAEMEQERAQSLATISAKVGLVADLNANATELGTVIADRDATIQNLIANGQAIEAQLQDARTWMEQLQTAMARNTSTISILESKCEQLGTKSTASNDRCVDLENQLAIEQQAHETTNDNLARARSEAAKAKSSMEARLCAAADQAKDLQASIDALKDQAKISRDELIKEKALHKKATIATRKLQDNHTQVAGDLEAAKEEYKHFDLYKDSATFLGTYQYVPEIALRIGAGKRTVDIKELKTIAKKAASKTHPDKPLGSKTACQFTLAARDLILAQAAVDNSYDQAWAQWSLYDAKSITDESAVNKARTNIAHYSQSYESVLADLNAVFENYASIMTDDEKASAWHTNFTRARDTQRQALVLKWEQIESSLKSIEHKWAAEAARKAESEATTPPISEGSSSSCSSGSSSDSSESSSGSSHYRPRGYYPTSGARYFKPDRTSQPRRKGFEFKY